VNEYNRLKGQKLAALFLVGCLLFNYPILDFVNKDGLLFGFPILYVYIFTVWTAIIGLAIVVVESRK